MINIVIILVVAIPQIWGLNLRMSSYNPLKSALQSLKSGMNSQIFCNVELNANNLEAVGFDMDFTLAQVGIDCTVECSANTYLHYLLVIINYLGVH